MSINRVTLIGRLGRDAELKHTANSTMCAFLIATTERYKRGEEWTETTEWHNVVVWGPLAEKCGSLLKGEEVFVEGKLTTRSWEKDGKKQYRTEVVANRVSPLAKLPSDASPRQRMDTGAVKPAAVSFDSDDIPF